MSKKKAKKDDFVNDALILEDAVGGNFSADICPSSRRYSHTISKCRGAKYVFWLKCVSYIQWKMLHGQSK